MEECERQCLCPLSLGLALGIIWGVALLIMAILVTFVGDYGAGFIKGIGSVYLGYDATFVGALAGLFWGFIDGFVAGVVVAWLYNFFCRITHRRTKE